MLATWSVHAWNLVLKSTRASRCISFKLLRMMGTGFAHPMKMSLAVGNISQLQMTRCTQRTDLIFIR
jgi:hypothetical protein